MMRQNLGPFCHPFLPTMLAPSLQVRPPDLARELQQWDPSPQPALRPTVSRRSRPEKAALAPFLPGFTTPIPTPVLSIPFLSPDQEAPPWPQGVEERLPLPQNLCPCLPVAVHLLQAQQVTWSQVYAPSPAPGPPREHWGLEVRWGLQASQVSLLHYPPSCPTSLFNTEGETFRSFPMRILLVELLPTCPSRPNQKPLQMGLEFRRVLVDFRGSNRCDL